MAILITWWREQKRAKSHPFILATLFHSKFEYIHPFSNGNGRVGRLIYIWMLQELGYGMILFENKNHQSYFSALDQADNGRPRKLYYHCVRNYSRTVNYLFKEIGV
jgi:Fic family protein